MIFSLLIASTSIAHAGEPTGAPSAMGEAEEGVKVAKEAVDVAKDAWKLVQDGRPVVHVDPFYINPETQSNGQNWEHQTGWKSHSVEGTEFQLVNNVGMERVDFHYRITSLYGGSVNGKGQYIKSIVVEPDGQDGNLNYAGWGTHLTVSISKPEITNGGSVKNPLEVVRFSVYIVAGAFGDYSRADHIRVQGDGTIVQEGGHPAEDAPAQP